MTEPRASESRLPPTATNLRRAKPYATAYVSRLIGVAVGVVLTVASARILQPQGRGEFAVAVAGVVMAVQFLNLGLSSSVHLFFARDHAYISRLLAPLWIYAGVCGALAGLIGLLLQSFWGGSRGGAVFDWWPLWAAWVPFQLIGLYQNSALMSLQDGWSIFRVELTGKAGAAILGISALIFRPGAVLPFLLALLASDALAAGLGAYWVRNRELPDPSRLEPPKDALTGALRLGLRVYPLLFLPYLLIKSDLLLLRLFRSAPETGVYSISSQIIDIGLILPTTIAGMGLASVVQASDSPRATVRLLRPTALFVSLALVGLPAVGKPVIRLLFGAGYEAAYPALLILLPGFAFLAFETILAQYFASRGYPWFLCHYWLFGVTVNIVLNIALIPRYGIFAAAATSSLGYGLVFVLICRRFLKESGLPVRSLLVGDLGGD